MSKIWPCERLCRHLSPIRKLWAEVLGWSLEHSLSAQWGSRAGSPGWISTAPGSSASQVSGFISCCQTQLLLLAVLVDCCGTWGTQVLTLGIVWASQWDQGWLRGSALGLTGCCRQAPAMWISSPDRSCLQLRCLGRGSYLSVVDQGCFRPQRTVCLASSCCSLCRRLGYLAMCSFSKGLCGHRLSWMMQ